MKTLAAESPLLDEASGNTRPASVGSHVRWRVRLGGHLAGLAGRLRGNPGFFSPVGVVMAMIAEAMAVGLMRRSDVEELVTQTYHSRPEFYDPNRYDLPYEESMLPALAKIKPQGRLLDAFCGQGREAKLFANAGYHVTAIDQLDWMIEAARQYATLEGFEAEFLVQDFDQMVVSDPFDVVYTSCWMYSTVQSRQRRQAFLTQCYRMCRSDGVIVLSHLGQSSGSVLGLRFRYAIAKITAFFTFGNLGTEQGERIYTGLFWHHLSDSTVEQEIDQAGMQIVERLPGTGMAPTFLFLAPKTEDVGSVPTEAR